MEICIRLVCMGMLVQAEALETQWKWIIYLKVSSHSSVMFSDSVKVIQINVNGFASRRGQLKSFIEKEGDCILVLNDTRLKEKTRYSDIPQFSMIRQDRKCLDGIPSAGR